MPVKQNHFTSYKRTSNMSLSSKLIVYNYYANFFLPNSVYGESYQLYRIVQEYLTESYVNGESCIEREIMAVRQLKYKECSFEDVRKTIDARDTVTCLSHWFNVGQMEGIASDVCDVLKRIDVLVPVAKRAESGWQIYNLDKFVNCIPDNIFDSLQPILGRFEHTIRDGKLLHIANVLNPTNNITGWWYNKFCVVTYIHRINNHTVPQKLTARLSEAVKKFIRLEENDYDGQLHIGESYNCSQVMTEIYGRFCGIGKEHFYKHKMSSVHILFQYLRDQITYDEKQFSCYSVIKDFGRQCKDVYKNLKNLIDSLYINCHTDKDKNALFDLLCLMDCEEIDVDCFYYIKKFLNK